MRQDAIDDKTRGGCFRSSVHDVDGKAVSVTLDVARVEDYRRELSGLRAQAEASSARLHIEWQQLVDSELLARAEVVSRHIQAVAFELLVLDRLGEALKRWL